METYPNVQKIPDAPTEVEDLYPESDGEPMADSDLHFKWIFWTRQVLEKRFEQRDDVYLSGDIMMYDIEGPLRTAAAPDILVTFGIQKGERRTYKVWEEGKAPDFVMEFPIERTYQDDLDGKMLHYASMGIPEYFLYDVDRCYLPEPLMGFRLVDDTYMQVSSKVDGGIHSEVLNLDFHLLDDGFGLCDPDAKQWLQTPVEAERERAEQAVEARQKAEERAEQAVEARQKAEERIQHAKERAEQEERIQQVVERVQQVEQRAEQAEERVQQAEAEVTRLREEIARLKALK